MSDTMPAEIAGAERHIYLAAADRARMSYRRKHGANVTMSRDERRAWNQSHADAIAAVAARAGLAAVRKTHQKRVDQLATMTDPARIGGAASGDWLAILETDAARASQRLAILASIGAAPARRRKAASVAPVAAPAKLRKTSKLVACERHASYWASLAPARRFQNAVEGGNRTACDSGDCVLTPGTDRYSESLVSRGPVSLAELNGAPAAIESPEPVADETPANVTPIRPAIDNTPESVAARRAMFSGLGWSTSTPTTPARVVADTSDDTPARYLCKTCGAESPAGIGYVSHVFGPMPAPASDCVGVHIGEPVRIAAPESVPAPMPRQTRAARKQSRRELADALRAVGLRPAGDVWTLATAGHEPAEIVRQVAAGADLATLAAETLAEMAR